MISVITPTVRAKGLELVAKALSEQTTQDFEWIIVFPKGSIDIKDIPCTIPQIRLIETEGRGDGFWSLNRDYNAAVRNALGQVVVSWQDYTYAGQKTLEFFWAKHKTSPNILVSGVGDKYSDTTWKEKIWQDPRRTSEYGLFYPCNFSDIEWNLCSVPIQAIWDVGGFDEDLDFLGFGMDAYSVNHRIASTGAYDTFLYQGPEIESFSLPHSRNDEWEEYNLIHGGYNLRQEWLMKSGQWPNVAALQSSKYRAYDVTNELYSLGSSARISC